MKSPFSQASITSCVVIDAYLLCSVLRSWLHLSSDPNRSRRTSEGVSVAPLGHLGCSMSPEPPVDLSRSPPQEPLLLTSLTLRNTQAQAQQDFRSGTWVFTRLETQATMTVTQKRLKAGQKVAFLCLTVIWVTMELALLGVLSVAC